MTIVFTGHVQKQEFYGADEVKLTIHGETSVCKEDIVVICPKHDAKMYPPGQQVRIQIHPLDTSWTGKP